jgi:hypothetical protein
MVVIENDMRYTRGSCKFWNRSIGRRRLKDFGGIRRDAVAARSRIILAGVGSEEKRACEFKKKGEIQTKPEFCLQS